MEITLRLESKTRKTETYTLIANDQIYRVTVSRSALRDTATTLRYVINRTLRLNSCDYVFLGNRRIGGRWVTEWTTVNGQEQTASL